MLLDLEKVDEAAAMLTFLTTSGIIPQTHVFYRQVYAFCSNALSMIEEQSMPSLYPALVRLQHAIQFNYKPVASYLLSGRGKHGLGRGFHQTP